MKNLSVLFLIIGLAACSQNYDIKSRSGPQAPSAPAPQGTETAPESSQDDGQKVQPDGELPDQQQAQPDQQTPDQQQILPEGPLPPGQHAQPDKKPIKPGVPQRPDPRKDKYALPDPQEPPQVQPNPPAPGPKARKLAPRVQDFEIRDSKKTDILIVIDNSISMEYEQQSMAKRFHKFIEALQGLEWRLAITTTDVLSTYTDKKTGKKRDAPWAGGRLLSFGKDKKGNSIYSISYEDDRKWAEVVFANTIQRPAREGSMDEQGIAATYMALEKVFDLKKENQVFAAPNKAFFSNNNTLNVVAVTDANESPKNKKATFRNKPKELLDYVSKQWGGKKSLIFHSIIVKPGDTACEENKRANNEDPGTTYAELSRLTNGSIGSVCEKDYGQQLSMLGESVAKSLDGFPLDSDPVDPNAVQLLSLDDGQPVNHKGVKGRRIEFDRLKPGRYRIQYSVYED